MLVSVSSVLKMTKSESEKASLKAWQDRIGFKESLRIKDEAAQRGTEMHSLIENFLLGRSNLNLFEQEKEKSHPQKMADLIISEGLKNKLSEINGSFPRLSYTKCIDLLKDADYNIEWGDDFGSPEESYISDQYNKPVIVYGFPSKIKAFYMKRDTENEDLSLGVDMIAPEGFGEIIGGGQREDDHDTLLKRINEHNLPIEPFQWYLDLRKYGSVPHSGFGLGIERTVGWICGTKHVRETIPYPRTMNRIEP